MKRKLTIVWTDDDVMSVAARSKISLSYEQAQEILAMLESVKTEGINHYVISDTITLWAADKIEYELYGGKAYKNKPATLINRVFANLSRIQHKKHGKGTCVGYVDQGRCVRVQFDSGSVFDFLPVILEKNLIWYSEK